MSTPAPRRVAVVGSGVAGLTAAYVASRTAHVTLYEADERLGGHADTHVVPTADGDLRIDTGFIVHNRRTYPTLLRLFAELGIATQPSEMSLSVSDRQTGVEYAGALGAARPLPDPGGADLARPLADARRDPALPPPGPGRADGVIRRLDLPVHARTTSARTRPCAPSSTRAASAPTSCGTSWSRWWPRSGRATRRPRWTTRRATCSRSSSTTGCSRIFGSPQWRTVTGGSATYVAALAAHLPEVRLGTKVTSVRETGDGVEVTDGSGETSSYDAVVVATHPSQALSMLEAPTALQREVLGAIPYSANTALLHTDASLLPDAAGARSSWNFRRPLEETGAVTVTYDLTRLQRLPTDTHYLVTLGGEDLVDPATVIDRMEYEHPLYTPASVAAQARLPEIDTDRVAFAGAYHGWGFHEDGARSGLAAATRLGLPWVRPEKAPVRPGRFETTIRHTRRTPFRRSFEHRSTFWLVDLDDLPDHGLLARFEARDHLGSPDATLRANVESFLADNGVSLGAPGAGRILMAAHPRSLGHCFNPISVFWCFDDAGAQAGVVVEVHNTYGDRHAYLVHPDEQGRARTPKAMYVSPFHGVDGWYDVAVPVPTDRLDIAVTLRGHDATPDSTAAPFSASLTGTRTDVPLRRTLGAALRGSALIRAHGTWLWARRLPVRPRPPHHQEGVR